MAVLIAGCNADSLVLPSEGEPAHVDIIDGNSQQGQVGTALVDSLSVSVTDSRDRPVVNQSVSFNITSGTVSPAVVVTNGQGVATFRWVLGTIAGSQQLEAGISSAGLLSPKVAFTAQADPGPVAGIYQLSGNGQISQAGTTLPESLVVALDDAFGNPVPGMEVTWLAGDGTLSSAAVITGSDGEASVAWTLGPTAGSQSASASFQGASGSPMTFSATATQSPPPELAVVTQPSASTGSGVPFAQQPVVRLVDSNGNPISQAGVSVTAAIASGGGTLAGSPSVSTDAAGVAAYTDLSISGAPGPRTLIFAAAGHTAAISSAINVTTPPPSATMSSVSAAPSTVPAGTGVSEITVTARDSAGNPIAGLPVILAVSGSGNTIVQPSGPTDAAGVAIGSISSTVAEAKTVSAEVGMTQVAQTASVSVVADVPAPATTTAHVPNGKPLRFTTIAITTRDAYGNPLKRGGYASLLDVQITGANSATPNVSDNGDGTYSASYLPFFTGDDVVAITLSGVHIQGSPYTSTVK